MGRIVLDKPRLEDRGIGLGRVIEIDGAIRGAGEELDSNALKSMLPFQECVEVYGHTYWPNPALYVTQCTGPKNTVRT